MHTSALVAWEVDPRIIGGSYSGDDDRQHDSHFIHSIIQLHQEKLGLRVIHSWKHLQSAAELL